MSKDEQLTEDKQEKLKNKIKTAEYNARMKEHGYKRKPIWLSRNSQQRLKQLSKNTTQEKAIEEALIIALAVAEIFPDGDFLDKADMLKSRLRAIERFNYDNASYVLREDADYLIRNRVAKAKEKLKS